MVYGQSPYTLDTNFRVPASQSNYSIGILDDIIAQPNGKILLNGSVRWQQGNKRSIGIARILSNGNFDTSFSSNVGVGNKLFNLPNNKVLVVGNNIGQLNPDFNLRGVKLNSNGSRDTSFRIYASDLPFFAKDIAIQPDGKFILVGRTNFDSQTGTNISRFMPSGERDPGFFLYFGNVACEVNNVLLNNDGSMFICGTFDTLQERSYKGIARVLTDGTLDTSFRPAVTNILSMARDSSGDVFVYYITQNPYTNRIAKLNSNLTQFQTSFAIQSNEGISNKIEKLYPLENGKLLATGSLSNWNSLRMRSILFFNTNGSLDISGARDTTQRNWTYRTVGAAISGGFVYIGAQDEYYSTLYPPNSEYAIKLRGLGCTYEQASNISSNLPRITPCLGSEIQLTAPQAQSYLWNTGETNQSIYVHNPGNYAVRTSLSDNCLGIASEPISVLFRDTICQGTTYAFADTIAPYFDTTQTNRFQLWASTAADSYQWFHENQPINGAFGRFINLQGEGLYTYRAEIGRRSSPLSIPYLYGTTSAKKVASKSISLTYKHNAYSIIATGGETIQTISLTDLSGRTLETWQNNSSEALIRNEGLAHGTYILQVSTSSGNYRTFKVIK